MQCWLPESYLPEQPWDLMGRNSLKEGRGVQTWSKDNGSLSQGRSNPEVNKVHIAQISL